MRQYDIYKESSVQWIGSVPAHWDVKPLFSVMYERKQKNIDNLEQNVLSLSYGRIIRRDVSKNFGLLPASFATYQVVQPGNLILRLTDLQNDKKSLRVGLVMEKGIITSAYACLAGYDDSHEIFGYYLLHAYDLMKVFYGEGAGVRQSMGFADLRRMPLLSPPLPEQRAIADFLDRKTAQIDVLIEKKQHQIELLQELRTATINQAVTKGLNPDAPMKDSGIEWLGEIPAHWEVSRLKFVGNALIGLTYSPEDIVDNGKGTLVLRASNVQNGKIEFSDNVFVKKEIPEHLIAQVGDILICSRSGSRSLIGKNALIDNNSAGYSFGVFMTIFRSEINDFVSYVLNSRIFKYQSGLFMTSTINQLTLASLNNFAIPVPPRIEQTEIIEYLEFRIRKIDNLLDKAVQQISYLQEHRTALISAAVTGKIDVREAQN
jgi:type I restriction enzyme, S subunit